MGLVVGYACFVVFLSISLFFSACRALRVSLFGSGVSVVVRLDEKTNMVSIYIYIYTYVYIY